METYKTARHDNWPEMEQNKDKRMKRLLFQSKALKINAICYDYKKHSSNMSQVALYFVTSPTNHRIKSSMNFTSDTTEVIYFELEFICMAQMFLFKAAGQVKRY